MTGSPASLESLSSPSPTPPPHPDRAVSNNGTNGASAGLDSGSELSELTEEEQEADTRLDNSDEDDEDSGTTRSLRRGRGGRKKRGGIVPAGMWEWAKPKSATVVQEEEEEEENAGPPEAMEEEEDEDQVHAHDTTIVPDGEEEEEEGEGDEPDPPTTRLKRRKTNQDDESGSELSQYGYYRDAKTKGRSLSPDESGNDSYSDDDDVLPTTVQARVASDLESNDTESEDDEEAPKPPDVVPIASAVPPAPTSDATHMDVELDVTAPPATAVAPLAAAAAASSIMAGSTVLQPPTPSPSSSVSPSPASSRSPSPAPGGASGEPEAAPNADPAAPVSTEAPVAAPHDDTEEQDLANDDEDMEVDSDLQPAHRMEALDVLAGIELKFALLRERLYIEKMEGLAWEEALLNEGTHPELIHLHTELAARRDKRLDLAFKKRSYEEAMAVKRRKCDEDAVWSWWQFAGDELQTDMISETNRKRRRLDRDRRALERPQPVRRIPHPPHSVPAAPTLRKIVKSFPFSDTRRKPSSAPASGALLYPELSTLSSGDIATDLEFLYANRRPAYEPRMAPAHVPPPFEGYGMTVNGSVSMEGAPPFGVQRNGMPPPPPPFPHHHHGSQAIPQGFPSRPPQPPTTTVLNLHARSPFTGDQDMSILASGSAPRHPQPPFHGHAPSAQGALHSNNGYLGHGYPGLRRSISPAHLGPDNKQNGNAWPPEGGARWPGHGRRPDGYPGSFEEDARMEEARMRANDAKRDKMRERDRMDRDLEREHREFDRERGYQLQQQQQMLAQQQQSQRHPPTAHPHIHPQPSGPGSHHHTVPHHHHHHHHHHVHHNHNPQQGPMPGIAGAPPRAVGVREFETSRSHSSAVHPGESLAPPSSKSGIPPSGSLWKADSDSHIPPSDYRDIRNSKHGSRPSSGPPLAPSIHDDRDRPLPLPFAMSSSYPSASSGPPSVAPSPRAPWGPPDDGHRVASSSSSSAPFANALDGHRNPPDHRYSRPPQQSTHSRQNSSGLGSPRSRPPPPRSPSSTHGFPGPMRSPTRYGPPSSQPPGMLSNHPPTFNIPPPSHTTTSPSLKQQLHRASSPKPFSPLLSGPGRTVTPAAMDLHNGNGGPARGAPPFNVGSRTASPHSSYAPNPMQSLPPARGPPTINGPEPHAVRGPESHPLRGPETHSPRPPPGPVLPPPKMNVAQMVDGP
ncbi:hypothetical protein PLICRDRAFT_173470 [Plicaturopsis crispa FD-325 SS-3]|nr:hypothetical protein PLICRDRAFT_173470 [Plicaturopsis crispa FD-325 SS-3]